MNTQRIAVLDGIRGAAIISVMLYHFSAPLRQVGELGSFDFILVKIFEFGWVGVDLFFVLSGFLITSILFRTAENPRYFSNFYVRRFLRIFPLYYAVLFVMIILGPPLSTAIADQNQLMVGDQIWYWTYLLNWRVAWLGGFDAVNGGYLWSLSVEEQFYMIWPLVIFYFRQKFVPLCLTTLCVIVLLRIVLLKNGISPTSIYVMTLTHIDPLLIGATVAALKYQDFNATTLMRFGRAMSVVGGIGILFIVLLQGEFRFYDSIVAHGGLLSIALLSGGILIHAIHCGETTIAHRLWSSQVLGSFGRLCYGLYLFHSPLSVLIENYVFSPLGFRIFGSYLPATIVYFAICFVTSYSLAKLSFKFFESPILGLKKYFI